VLLRDGWTGGLFIHQVGSSLQMETDGESKMETDGESKPEAAEVRRAGELARSTSWPFRR
jgi:hypothetical protein